jgi:hypothetical protein
MSMIVNAQKTKVMIIKSNKILEEVTSYKILESIFTTSSIGISIDKLIIDEKLIMGLKTIVIQWIFGYGIRRKPLLHLLFFMGVNSRDIVSLLEKYRENTKEFYTYNLKIKGNTPYPILLLARYLMYKNKINNMEDNMLPKIGSKSSGNHHGLK